MALAFYNSAEHQGLVVQSYYLTFLGRAGGSAEVNTWVAQMQAGMTESQTAIGFLGSAEYQARWATPTEFVKSLNENVLGRSATTAEATAWVNQISGGMSFTAVAQGIVMSSEQNTRSVVVFYNVFLAVEPDQPGETYWVTQLNDGAMTLPDVAANILASPAFWTRAEASVG